MKDSKELREALRSEMMLGETSLFDLMMKNISEATKKRIMALRELNEKCVRVSTIVRKYKVHRDTARKWRNECDC